MAAQSAGRGAGDINQQVTELEAEVARLKASIAAGSKIKVLLGLCLVGFVGFVGWKVYDAYRTVTAPSYRDKVYALAQERFKKNEDMLKKEGQLLADRVNPILQKAFTEQFKKDEPKLVQAANAEVEPFKKEMQKQALARIQEHYAQIIVASRADLEKEFPELKKDSAKFKKFEDGLMSAVHTVLEKEFVGPYEAGIAAVNKEFEAFPAAPSARPGEMSVAQQIIGHLLEFVALSLAKGNSLAVFDERAAGADLKPATKSAPKSDGKKG